MGTNKTKMDPMKPKKNANIYINNLMHRMRLKLYDTMKKKGVLQLALQLNFWVALDTYNSPYIWCNSLQLNYNFVAITPFQLLCNSPMTIIIMSCWCHFSFIHQILTHGTMRIFCDFFEILISIFHSLFVLDGSGLWHLA